jgi:hypothetical protein
MSTPNELEREMLAMAKESFRIHWCQRCSPSTVEQLQEWYPPEAHTLSEGIRRVLICGMKLNWHHDLKVSA